MSALDISAKTPVSRFAIVANPPKKAKDEPRNAGTLNLEHRWKNNVPIPAQIKVCLLYTSVNQEYLARTSGIMSAASIAAMPVLSFLISGLVSFVTTAQCFIFAGVCALLEGIWILKNKGIEEYM